jgi:hypothetical protein
VQLHANTAQKPAIGRPAKSLTMMMTTLATSQIGARQRMTASNLKSTRRLSLFLCPGTHIRDRWLV